MRAGKRIILSLALALFAGASLQAAPITEGQWLQLNFSNGFYDSNHDNFNYFATANSGLNSTTGDSATMIDSLGNSVDATLSASGFGGGSWSANNDSWSGLGTSTPAPGTSTWAQNEIRNFWWANGTTPVLTLGGLDASLSYNVYIYSKMNGGQAGEVTTVDINGTSQDMASRANRFLDSDEDLLFQNVALDGSGDLVITMLNGPGSLQYNPVLNAIVIEAVQPESFHHDGVLAEWTFNSELGSSSAERLASTTLVPGLSVSALAIHPEVDDFGIGVVPNNDNDGLGFGGNSGENVIFWVGANYTNDDAPVGESTTWGKPGEDTGISTASADAPMSFTVTAGAGQSVTINSLLIHCVGGYGPFTVYVQEAGALSGLGSTASAYVTVPMSAPVTISAGSSRTFTINWKGDELDTGVSINEIDLRGSVSSIGTQRTIRTQYSDAVGQATPPSGWAFYWNAPDGWSPGVTGDLATGEVTDDSSWTPMVWGAGMWTADGNSNGGDSLPDGHLRIITSSGHVGGSGATRELDRYCISAFTVDAAGDYQIGQAWIQKPSSSGNGLLVKIFLNGQLFKTIECAAGDVEHFDARFEDLEVGDEIAVAVGSNGDSGYDTYSMDYRIVLVDPTFDGLATFDVADYGAVGDGSTDDFDAIHAAVNAAKSAGGGIVRFDGTKTYRTIGASISENIIENVFELEGTSNIKIEGNGASLLIHPPDRFARVDNSSNVQIDGFTITYGPLPYYQGTIDAIDVGNLTMDITVPNRYPEPETGTNTLYGGSHGNNFFARSFVPDSAGARWGGGYHLFIDSMETIGGDPRNIRLKFRSDQTPDLQGTLNDGATEMVVPHIRYGHRGNFSLVIDSSDRVKVSNVLYRNTPLFLCVPVNNVGPVTLSNVDVLTADPTNELFVTWRDGFHVKDNRFGVLIEDGDWHGGAMNDDLFNFSHMLKHVTSVSGNELSLKAVDGFGGQNRWYAGEWVSVWDPTRTLLKGRARIAAPASTLTWNNTLTLDGPIAADVDDWVVNESALNRGMLVRNCTTYPLGTRPASCRLSTPTTFKDLHFDGAYLWIYDGSKGVEGPDPRDMLFENCYIRGGGSDPWLSQPIDIVLGENIVFKNTTVDDGRINVVGSEVNFDGVDWINNSGDVLSLHESSTAYVFNQSSRNGGPVVLGDVSLYGGSQVFLEAPPGYPPPESGYGDWSELYNLWGDDAAATNDVDFDGMNNLLEYALGGNPTNADAAAVLPVFGPGQDGDWFYHVYNERTDDPTLTYTVELNTNLVSGSWSTNGVEWVDEAAFSNVWKTVTNKVPTLGNDQQFIRLKIEQE